MKNAFRCLGLITLLVGVLVTSSLAAGPSAPPNSAAVGAAIMGSQSRATVAAIQAGKPAVVKVQNPESLKALGLTGLKQGDKVEITPVGDNAWKIKNPKTNEVIQVNVQVQKVE